MIERLKLYMAHRGLMASQFADAIQMPRSSFSQLMNGRNKTIADTTIVKIHAVYPELSISWLLFGEGEMLVDGNTPIASPVKTQSQLSIYRDNSINVKESDCSGMCLDSTETSADERSETSVGLVQSVPSVANTVLSTILPPTSVSSNRKIARIMVFYDDNTFECFKPE